MKKSCAVISQALYHFLSFLSAGHTRTHTQAETKCRIIEGGNTHVVYFYPPTSVSDFHAKALTFSSSLASLVHTIDQVQAVISGHAGPRALLQLPCIHIKCQLMPPSLPEAAHVFFSLSFPISISRFPWFLRRLRPSLLLLLSPGFSFYICCWKVTPLTPTHPSPSINNSCLRQARERKKEE